MSDLFWNQVPTSYRLEILEVMRDTPHITYQVLTKRAEEMAVWSWAYPFPDNVWVGVTIENQRTVDRLTYLLETDAATRFVSAEPLLEPISLDTSTIDWLIIGGESGAHLGNPLIARRRGLAVKTNGSWTPISEKTDWVRRLVHSCRDTGTPVFFKQWGGTRPDSAGCTLDGETLKQ
jgi:protein gp37